MNLNNNCRKKLIVNLLFITNSLIHKQFLPKIIKKTFDDNNIYSDRKLRRLLKIKCLSFYYYHAIFGLFIGSMNVKRIIKCVNNAK